MKRLICFLPALLFTSVLFAQKEVPEFGKIDPADLRLRSCSFEAGASAMKLFDVQEIEFEPSDYTSRLRTERRVRIKIFNEKGYKHGTIRIPYFSKKRLTKIKELKGVIYNLDSAGNLVIQKLEKKDFFKEKAEDNLGVISFTFPNLKPGSIIEYSYTKVEKNIIQIDPWIIQSEIPVAYASTIIMTPSNSRIKEKISGADTIEQRTEETKKGYYGTTKKIYFRDNIVSFQPEPFMSSSKDNLLKIVFLLIPRSNFFVDAITSEKSMWRFAGNRLMRSPYFGGQIDKPVPGTEKLIDSARAIANIADRISFLYEAVKKRVPDKAEQTLYPNDIVEAWNNKAGNTAEINLLLLNLLKKAGVVSYPLLVSTREHGKVDMNFPSIGQLNGVDVLAADSDHVYVMDASLKYQSFHNPPLNILNRNAFLLQDDDMKWVAIDDPRPLLRQNLTIQGILKEDGSIEGTAYWLHYDYAKSLMLDSSLEEEKEDRFYDKKPEGLDIRSVTFEDADDDNKPLLQKMDFTYVPQQTGDFYFINPQLLSLEKQNPFVKETRNTDIDLGCNQELSLKLHLALPTGFQVEAIPKNIIVRAPDTSFFFKRVVQSDSTGVFLTQIFNINQSIFYKENYPALREFFQRVYALMAEEITVKRKK